jgi:hypothetical protein
MKIPMMPKGVEHPKALSTHSTAACSYFSKRLAAAGILSNKQWVITWG